MKKLMAALRTETGGATAIEYSMMAAGISLAILASVFAFGDDFANMLKTFSAYLNL
jgi:Flp pilus assembly pilin Flp